MLLSSLVVLRFAHNSSLVKSQPSVVALGLFVIVFRCFRIT